MTDRSARLVVLASGSGTNLAAIMTACAEGQLPASVVAVVANRSDAYALTRAAEAGIDAIVLEAHSGEPRAAYDARLAAAVEACQPDLVILAGWMRILTPVFVERFPVINLHPALPGQFPGAHAIDEAYAAWQAGRIDRSGVMIHWVPDAGVDNGPVILTAEVPFAPDDTPESFEARVHEIEHRAIVEGTALALAERDRLPAPRSLEQL